LIIEWSELLVSFGLVFIWSPDNETESCKLLCFRGITVTIDTNQSFSFLEYLLCPFTIVPLAVEFDLCRLVCVEGDILNLSPMFVVAHPHTSNNFGKRDFKNALKLSVGHFAKERCFNHFVSFIVICVPEKHLN